MRLSVSLARRDGLLINNAPVAAKRANEMDDLIFIIRLLRIVLIRDDDIRPGSVFKGVVVLCDFKSY